MRRNNTVVKLRSVLYPFNRFFNLSVIFSLLAGLIVSMPQIGSLKEEHGKNNCWENADFSLVAVQCIMGSG